MTTGAKLTVILAVALVLLAVVYFVVFVPQGDLPMKAVDPQMSEGQLQQAALSGTAPNAANRTPALEAQVHQLPSPLEVNMTAVSDSQNAIIDPSSAQIMATLMPPTVALARVGGPSSGVHWQTLPVETQQEISTNEVVPVTPHHQRRTSGGRVSAVVANPGADIEISQTAVTGRLYTIKPGDTLSDISLAWFGTSVRWQEIVAANPGLNPNRMRVGHRITLPAKLKAASPGRAIASAPPKMHTKGTYVVQAGDSLTTIAQEKLGSMRHWRQLWEINRAVIGSDPDALKVGMRLQLYRK